MPAAKPAAKPAAARGKVRKAVSEPADHRRKRSSTRSDPIEPAEAEQRSVAAQPAAPPRSMHARASSVLGSIESGLKTISIKFRGKSKRHKVALADVPAAAAPPAARAPAPRDDLSDDGWDEEEGEMECESPASVVSHASTESSAGSSADGDDDALDGRVDGPPEEAAAAAAAAAAIDDAGEDAGEDADEDEPGEPEAGAGDEPTKPKKLAISKLTTATGDGSAPCVALDLVTSGNSKSLRIIALSACYVGPLDEYGQTAPTNLVTFSEYVKIDASADAKHVASTHGLSYEQLQAEAAESTFADVGRRFLDWLGTHATPASATPPAFVMWDGVRQGHFALLCAELLRHGLRLPSGCTAVDALHVAKSGTRTYGSVTVQEWPEREGRGGAGKPKLTLELCANYALSQLELPADPNRRRAAPPKKRSLPPRPADVFGEAKAAMSVKQLAVVLADSGGVRVKLKKKLWVTAAPFEAWATKLVAYEVHQRTDPIDVAHWTERGDQVGGSFSLPSRCSASPNGPGFTPKPGCSPTGGPSQKLRRALGLPAVPPTRAPPPRNTSSTRRTRSYENETRVLKVNEVCWYVDASDGNKKKKVTVHRVDYSVVPPSYQIDLDGHVRDTQRDRLTPIASDDDDATDPTSADASASMDGVEMTAETLLLKLCEYFLPLELIQLLADSTNAKCNEIVVRVKENGKWTLRPPKLGDPATLARRPRVRDHVPITVGTMAIFLAHRILMGVHHRDQVAHYWLRKPGFHVPMIANSMTLSRHKEILANLSFSFNLDPDYYPDDKLRKMKEAVDLIRKLCIDGWDVEPDAAVDESRVKLLSRYCSFVWTMLCKPIKVGVTIYCLVFGSGYLHNFEIFTGSGGKSERGYDAPMGQPTDEADLDEDDDRATGYIDWLLDQLVGEQFDGTRATIYTDKAFTTIKKAKAFAKRGVALVGMARGTRPKEPARGKTWGDYWAFRKYNKSEAAEFPRGYVREAYQELPEGRYGKWWLKCELWRDSRFVTLLSTTYFQEERVQVERWTAELRKKVSLQASRALQMYQKMMGCVDRFNRGLAESKMGMGRCKQRYHRQLFLGWLLPALVINMRVAFKALWPTDAMEELLKLKHVPTLGFNRWFQLEVGRVLLQFGQKLNKDEDSSCSPRPSGRVPADLPGGDGSRCELVSASEKTGTKLTRGLRYVPWLGQGKRKKAKATAKTKNGNCAVCLLQPPGKRSGGKRKQCVTWCLHCRRFICRGCYDAGGHLEALRTGRKALIR